MANSISQIDFKWKFHVLLSMSKTLPNWFYDAFTFHMAQLISFKRYEIWKRHIFSLTASNHDCLRRNCQFSEEKAFVCLSCEADCSSVCRLLVSITKPDIHEPLHYDVKCFWKCIEHKIQTGRLFNYPHFSGLTLRYSSAKMFLKLPNTNIWNDCLVQVCIL